MDLLQLVQVGFHGTALAFLLLGYRLMKQLLDAKAGDDKKLETQHKSVRFFLLVSVAVLLIGIGSQFLANHFSRNYTVAVLQSPRKVPFNVPEPTIDSEGGQVKIIDGRGSLTVGRDSLIQLDIYELVDKIQTLNIIISRLQGEIATKTESTGGYDEDAG